MQRKISIEIGMLACAVGLSWIAMFAGLHGGLLSPDNSRYAIKVGVVCYIVGRLLSAAPLVPQWSSAARCLMLILLEMFAFYLFVVWTTARS